MNRPDVRDWAEEQASHRQGREADPPVRVGAARLDRTMRPIPKTRFPPGREPTRARGGERAAG